MANEGEEQNTQQSRGRNGVGSRKKNQEIFEGAVPKQKGSGGTRVGSRSTEQKNSKSEGEVPKQERRPRGRPRSSKSDEQKREEKRQKSQDDRKRKKDEFERLKKSNEEYRLEVGILREILLKKYGATEEDLEAIRKGASWEELVKVWQTSEDEIPAQKKILQDKAEEDFDGALVSREAAMNVPIKQDADKEKRASHSKEYYETLQFLSKLPMDDYDDLSWCNFGQHGTSFNGQSPMQVCDDEAMCQLPEWPMGDDLISSLACGELPPIYDNFSRGEDLRSDTTHSDFWQRPFTAGDP